MKIYFWLPFLPFFRRSSSPKALLDWVYSGLKRHIVKIAVLALVILFALTAWFVVWKIHPTFQMAEEIQKALSGQTTINKDYTTTQVEYVKGIFTLIAGLVGILVLMKSFFTHELDREKAQLEMTKAQNERFAKALEHLGDDAIDIRLGGIFALEALMNENPEHFASRVITQLCAYSSNRGAQLNALLEQNNQKERLDNYSIDEAKEFEKALRKLQKPPSLPPFADLETTAQILCTTPHWKTHYKKPLQLRNVFWWRFELKNASNLMGADLTEANLTKASLTNANLVRAKLRSADLTEADLTEASLTRANLTRASLTNANLTNTDLTNTDLMWANLTNAYLIGANLTEASLAWVNLTNTYLIKANLTNAYLIEANLIKTHLSGANLTRAKLSGYLIEANLMGANLRGANLAWNCEQSLFYQTQIQLSQITHLKKLSRCIPAQGVDIDYLRKNLGNDSLWEQHPETLTDEEVIERLQLIVVDEDAPIPPPSADPETT